ncbi:MAG: TIGR04283 family arsenosugar biosynthesis glycosyltransferase [Phycisphaerae bacterium]
MSLVNSDNQAPIHNPRRISVVIPARNEEEGIGRVLCRIAEEPVWETIVADGGSTDRTRDVARSLGARVVAAPIGRGRQISAGARSATGDALLFLHADTLLPPSFSRHISDTLNKPGVSGGAFLLGIDRPGARFRMIETLANARSRWFSRPYGDQAIFVDRGVFDRIGGFPELPVMEDVAFIRLLKKLGRVEMAPVAVSTSARRWLENGVVLTTVHNQLCLFAYVVGVSPERIARWRGRGDVHDRKPNHSVNLSETRT